MGGGGDLRIAVAAIVVLTLVLIFGYALLV
jgi:hypothetical protein